MRRHEEEILRFAWIEGFITLEGLTRGYFWALSFLASIWSAHREPGRGAIPSRGSPSPLRRATQHSFLNMVDKLFSCLHRTGPILLVNWKDVEELIESKKENDI
jgi:hypothetical protein